MFQPRQKIFWLAAWLIVAAAATCTAIPTEAASLSPSETRARFHSLLDRPKVPLAPRVTRETVGDFIQEHGEFSTEAKQTVPFVAVKSATAKGKLPAVIVLHGTGGDKRQGRIGTVLETLAGRGILAIALDARYHGDRVPGGARQSKEYEDAIIRAWREKDPKKQEHPFYFDTAYDLWRAVDYLESRPDVDAKRIGVIGFSMGGIEAWLAAATDERIRVVVPAISVQSFRWSLENAQWQGRALTIQRAHETVAKDLGKASVDGKAVQALWDKLIPGILDEFDCPNMLRAIAPRPLLILSGENDPNNPLGGAKVAFAAAEEAYKHARAEERLKIHVAKGAGHEVTEEQLELAYEWLDHWLKQ